MRAPASYRLTAPVFGIPIDALGWPAAVGRIFDWCSRRESRYVCLCNAHSVVTARQDSSFADAILGADMAAPDGAPVAWMLRQLGFRGQRRISGPDLMWRCCERAERDGLSIYLFGGRPETLEGLQRSLKSSFPRLRIAGAHSPPFRPATQDEDEADAQRINASGASIVWVGLGCPKQEVWMARQHNRVNAVMLGVGAAFSFHGGTARRAPLWMQDRGLEWLHRLACEPRRLGRRYLVTNSLFLLGAFQQLTGRDFPELRRDRT